MRGDCFIYHFCNKGYFGDPEKNTTPIPFVLYLADRVSGHQVQMKGQRSTCETDRLTRSEAQTNESTVKLRNLVVNT